MDGVSLIIFGPSDGFRAVAMPAIAELHGDGYALSSSDMMLNENGAVLIARRCQLGSGGKGIRLTSYRQIYEGNLRRLGHSYGVSLEFSDGLPSTASALDVMSGLMTLVEGGCVTNGRFCDTKVFYSFLKEVEGLIDRAMADLQGSKSTPLESLEGNNEVSIFYARKLNAEIFSADAASLIDSFLYRVGGMLLSTLAIHSGTNVEHGSSAKELPSFEMLDQHAVSVLLKNGKNNRSLLTDLQTNLAEVERSKHALVSKIAELESQSKGFFDSENYLKRKIQELQNQSRHSLNEVDFGRIKQIVNESTRTRSPEHRPIPDQQPDRLSYDDQPASLFLIVLVSILILVVVIGMIDYFWPR